LFLNKKTEKTEDEIYIVPAELSTIVPKDPSPTNKDKTMDEGFNRPHYASSRDDESPKSIKEKTLTSRRENHVIKETSLLRATE